MKTRTRTLKLFLRWNKTERRRFINLIRVNKVTKNSINFNFVGVPHNISGCFICGEKLNSAISIWVHWKKDRCDLLYLIRLNAKRSTQGWFCGLCDKTGCNQTKEEFLAKHIFESFLEWCNGNLLEVKDNQEIEFKDQQAFHKVTHYSDNGECICIGRNM